MAPQVGLEPTTVRLTAECSTTELLRNNKERIIMVGLNGLTQLVALLVVQVDEARVGFRARPRPCSPRVSSTSCKVERRVDRRARLRQQPKVTSRYVHGAIVGRTASDLAKAPSPMLNKTLTRLALLHHMAWIGSAQ